MKTPWSNLLQYGTGIAVLIVITISILGLLLAVSIAVLLSKILVITR